MTLLMEDDDLDLTAVCAVIRFIPMMSLQMAFQNLVTNLIQTEIT
jgi:hypothetical protein